MSDKFDKLLPPLSSEEFSALKADVQENGVQHAVFVDEDGNVLDGRNRLRIDKNARRKVIRGLSEAEKEAFVFRCNFNRRNLTPDQKAEVQKSMKKTAERLRTEDAKKWTQSKVAKALGVAQQTVADWLSNNTGAGKATKPKPDARVALSESAQNKAFDRVKAGESQSQVAADFGVSQKTISNVVAKIQKKRDKESEKAERAAKGAKLESEGFIVGDFREVAKSIPDETVDVLFTDPPYHREHLELYAGAAEVAARVLKDGGSLLCYCGQYLVPQIIEAMSPHLRFWWICAVQHGGKKARMNEYGIVVNWKPVLWFVKGTRGDKRTFIDDMVMGQREKDTHDWQQSVLEANHFIGKLCPESGVVFDPFCGGGTTAISCRSLNRKFITCDIDERTLNIAKERFSSES